MNEELPFYFYVENPPQLKFHLVRITSHWDVKLYNHQWWGEENLAKCRVYSPDVDLVKADYWFDTWEEARAFIRDWWAAHP